MYTETVVLNKLSKQELVPQAHNTEANMESQTFVIKNETKDSLAYFRKLEADVAILGNVNEKLKERLVSNKKQF